MLPVAAGALGAKWRAAYCTAERCEWKKSSDFCRSRGTFEPEDPRPMKLYFVDSIPEQEVHTKRGDFSGRLGLLRGSGPSREVENRDPVHQISGGLTCYL